MTREEAIDHLKTIGQYYSQDHSDPYEECEILTKDELDALYLAIKALEQEPCEDAIDREYLFKVLDDFCGHDRTATVTLDTLADLVYDMPTVTQKSGNKYRKEAKRWKNKWLQSQKTGKWIKTISENGITSAVRCSECGFEDNRYMLFRYCPNCGARMIESEEV